MSRQDLVAKEDTIHILICGSLSHEFDTVLRRIDFFTEQLGSLSDDQDTPLSPAFIKLSRREEYSFSSTLVTFSPGIRDCFRKTKKKVFIL